jgi:hypothetical protein
VEARRSFLQRARLLDQLRVQLSGDLLAAGDDRCSLNDCVTLAADGALALSQFGLMRSLARLLSGQGLAQFLELSFAASDRNGGFVELGGLDREIR